MTNDTELNVVTEIGIFGELDMDDPTKKKVKGKLQDEELNKLIEESISKNLEL